MLIWGVGLGQHGFISCNKCPFCRMLVMGDAVPVGGGEQGVYGKSVYLLILLCT